MFLENSQAVSSLKIFDWKGNAVLLLRQEVADKQNMLLWDSQSLGDKDVINFLRTRMRIQHEKVIQHSNEDSAF